ncbi:TonB-dependent siderophore receptor [Aggregatibacter actinomycetemcomitans]|nr:TonB-dependent siderophore receptor [Aggregatibacter actinomycetemcomitans]
MRKSHLSSNHYFQLSLISAALFVAYQTAMAEDTLEQINITEEADTNTTAGSKGYTIKSMNTATGLKIAGKDTPQSVSVITKKQLDDKAIHTLEDAMKNTTGINVVRDSGLQTRFLSRGFYVDQIGEDGITTNVGGRSGYTAKIDVSPSTDLAIYDHIEVVRGATGLTQSNAEPGGTINLIRKRPTDKFQHLGEITVDHRGSARTMLDVSGGLNQDNSIRGRLVGVGEKSKSFKNNVHGKKGLIYGVTDVNLGNVGVFTLGGMYQKINEVPDFAGVMLPCENPPVAPFASRPACNDPLKLPRNTYLGQSWSRLTGDKYNLFANTKFVFDNDWELTIEASYTKNNSDAKIGQFFIKDEHAAGLSGSDATAFLTEKGEVIPFEPKDKALKKLQEYREQATQEYERRKTDYAQNNFNNEDFNQYRNERLVSRQKGYEQCMNDFGLDFLCGDWVDPGIDKDKQEYIDKKLQEMGIANDAENRFSNSLYNRAYNNKDTTNRKFTFTPIRHLKKDEQYGIKLNLTGTYTLFDRSHDFYLGYAYNNEHIRSDYTEIFQKKYRIRTLEEVGQVHQHLAGTCIIDDKGSYYSPMDKGIREPDWGKYDKNGNHTVYIPECENAYKVKVDNNGNIMYERDQNGNKIPERDSDGNIKYKNGAYGNPNEIIYKMLKEPDNYDVARYNYSKYINKNKTHALIMSTRFNATEQLHLLGGLQLTYFETSQSKETPVYNGEPLSHYQSQSNIAKDNEHYTAKMKGHRFTPYAGITYDLTDEQSVYASYTKIFKQQDNVDITNKTVLPPLIGTNYEIGWKGSFFEKRLNSALALFSTEQKNRTVVDFGYIPGKAGTVGSFQTIARPIGRVVSKGFEFELAGNVTENWQLFAGYTYNKSKYKNAEEINNERAKGAKDPYNFSNFTPVQMLRLATSYRIPNTKWTIGGGISAQSPTSSLYGIKQAGYTLFDANVQYEFNTHAKLSLIGTNLTDKTYFENNYNRTRGMNNFYGRPRTVMMKFDWQF